MPLFQFDPPRELPDFILYIWHSLGKTSPSIPDLKFFLSFRSKLMTPSKAQELIDKALHEGLLINKNNILSLSEKLQMRQAEQEQVEKERIQRILKQQSRKQKAQFTKSFNDYFREILPKDYQNKSFLIKLTDIKLEIPDIPALNAKYIRGIINIENQPPIEIIIDRVACTLTHSCEFSTPLYKKTLKLCPHLGAIFRYLQKEYPDLALDLIKSLSEKGDKWRWI